MTNGAPTSPPSALRRLDTANATALVDLAATFEDLQTVLRCCERLVQALAEPAATDGEPDDVMIEAVWTTALLSYARCFSAAEAGSSLTEDDVTSTVSSAEVLEWHKVLLQLRDHYADPALNPREQFSVGVTQNSDGSADGIGITSARQPLVDDLTVRQTGAIAYALSALVNDRITAQQQSVFSELKNRPQADLDALPLVEFVAPDADPG